MLEQKVIFKINWQDLQVIAIANRMVLVIWNGEQAWMDKSVFNRISLRHGWDIDPKSRSGAKPAIRPVFGLIVEQTGKDGKPFKVFETLRW